MFAAVPAGVSDILALDGTMKNLLSVVSVRPKRVRRVNRAGEKWSCQFCQ